MWGVGWGGGPGGVGRGGDESGQPARWNSNESKSNHRKSAGYLHSSGNDRIIVCNEGQFCHGCIIVSQASMAGVDSFDVTDSHDGRICPPLSVFMSLFLLSRPFRCRFLLKQVV